MSIRSSGAGDDSSILYIEVKPVLDLKFLLFNKLSQDHDEQDYLPPQTIMVSVRFLSCQIFGIVIMRLIVTFDVRLCAPCTVLGNVMGV